MPIKKEIDSCYSDKESLVDVILAILSRNSSYKDFLQTTAENIGNQVTVVNDE